MEYARWLAEAQATIVHKRVARPPDTSLAGIDTEAAVSVWRISSAATDRDNDRVSQRNWDLQGWKNQGSPWLLDHGKTCSVPIGSSCPPGGGPAQIWSDGADTYAKLFHDQNTSIGCDCWALVQSGILNGASIGFLPSRPVKRNGGRGHEINGLELIEISLTAVPSNPSCYRLDNKSVRGERDMVLKSVTRVAKAVELDVLTRELIAEARLGAPVPAA